MRGRWSKKGSPSGTPKFLIPGERPGEPAGGIAMRDRSILPRRSALFRPACLLLFLPALLLLGFPQQMRAQMSADMDSHYEQTCINSDCHPVEVGGTIPKHIPYLEGECLECHTDHSAPEGEMLKVTGDQMCLECHTEIELSESGSNPIHPPGDKQCLACHDPHESRVRNLVRSEDILHQCAECHAEFLEKGRQMAYRHDYFDPVDECGSCHYAHRRSQEKYLHEDVTQSCLTCHDMTIELKERMLENVGGEMTEATFVHGAMKEEGCPTCHTPHGSSQSSLLLPGYPAGKYQVYKREDFALCWQCHNPEIVEKRGGSGITNFRSAETSLHRVHVLQLKRGRACHTCHAAHAAEVSHLLRPVVRFKEWTAPLEFEQTQHGGTCISPCHRAKSYNRTKVLEESLN